MDEDIMNEKVTCKMEMCEEMIKLREKLDNRGIKWEDKSELKDLGGFDFTMYRTHFEYENYFYSVVWGHGSYGEHSGTLECMTDKVNGGEPVGSLTAAEVIGIMDGTYMKGE